MALEQAHEVKNTRYRAFPKVDLHRHLEGSLRLSTLAEIAAGERLDLPYQDLTRLSALVQVQADDPNDHFNFLSKFKTLRHFFRSPEVIRRITREAVTDAARDNVLYLELRFTPVALSRVRDYPLSEVMDWVVESAHQAAAANGILVRLIASANRNESVDLAAAVARLAGERRDRGLVALDLAGDEANFPAEPFYGIYREARQDGLRLTLHAGEWAGAANVVEAIQQMGAERIGHGVRVMEDAAAVDLARERRTVFEVCLTSNVQSGVVPELASHPLVAMLDAGLNATLNTDDPGISQIALSDEYRLACETLSLPLHRLRERVLAAGQAAFLPEKEKAALLKRLETALG